MPQVLDLNNVQFMPGRETIALCLHCKDTKKNIEKQIVHIFS